MTDYELMQQALSVLCNNVYPRDGVRDNRHLTPKSHADIYQQTIDTLFNRLAQPEQKLVIDCPRCGHCCPQRLIEEMPSPLSKGQAWSKWWYETRGKHMVAGGAHPMEWAMYDAFNSGWDAAKQNSEKD